MQLKDFDKKYRHSINKGLSFDKIGRLRDYVNFDFDVFLPTIGMNLQRELVWTAEQKSALILTLLRNQRITPIVVVQTEKDADRKNNWQVIDGKQRLTTMFAFLDNEFPITYKGVEYYFKYLPEDCQKRLFNYDMYVVYVHYSYNDSPISDQTKIDLFEEINWLGTPQDISHMNKLKNEY
jgi:uncharacterized protein with ParB-like and HNH nuclease domain